MVEGRFQDVVEGRFQRMVEGRFQRVLKGGSRGWLRKVLEGDERSSRGG